MCARERERKKERKKAIEVIVLDRHKHDFSQATVKGNA